MKRLPLACLAALASVAVFGGVASAQAKPEFKLGFQALAEQVPDIVGQPLENEHWGWNGDSLQQTTKGLMAWRKADNWTAFTDGSTTWINGPNGVQRRPNGDLFPWEAPAPLIYSPEVKAVDQPSGQYIAMVNTFMKDLEEDWAGAWQWKPRKPVTVYLTSAPNGFADLLAQLRGRPLSDAEKTAVPGYMSSWSNDIQTGGWAMYINIPKATAGVNWENNMKASGLAMAYAQILQVDLATGNSPRWYREAFGGLLAFAKVPAATNDDWKIRAVTAYRNQGKLPSLRSVIQNYETLTAAGGDSGAMATGVTYLALGYLSDKVGVKALLDVEKRVAAGDNLEAALQAVTGYTIDRLGDEYQVKIPR